MARIEALKRLHGRQYVGQADFDAIQHEVDRWFMRVPADADGVPVHVGVMVTDLDGIPLMVEAVGEECVFLCNEDAVTTEFALARECHRYHEPTVEDVLREFACEFNRDDSELCDDEIIEAFAKRLRLADE